MSSRSMSRIGKTATAKRKQGAEGDRDSWTTPTWITDALGKVELDPCSNRRSTVQARRVFRLEDGQDGLALAPTVKAGDRVFINPPYSSGQVIRWVKAYEHTRFCFLLRFDPSTEWFRLLYQRSGLVCVPRKRVNFDPPPGVKAFTNVYPHSLFFARFDDASEQIKRLCFSWRTR